MNPAYLDFGLDFDSEFGLNKWLEHIQTQHWRTIDLTLDRVSQVWNNLEGKCANFTLVVAGTNGKGSCVSMLDGVFQQSGNRTGAYTSPHLVRFNERIRIDGTEATDEDICQAFVQIEQARAGIPLTYFEFGTLAALLIFQQYNVDIAILEVGMGGRLDAVNMVDNDLVLMTSIGVDHEQWLGSDRESIAAEKAGVIKQDGIVVCSDPDIPESVLTISNQQNATVIRAERDYSIEQIGNRVASEIENGRGLRWKSNHAEIPQDWRCISSLVPSFNGHHQITNLGGVVAALALTSGKTGVTVADLTQGLNRARLSARCQVMINRSDDCPEVIVDVAHNQDSAIKLAEFLSGRECAGKTYAVIGVLADKALDQIIKPMMAHVDYWFLASLSGERGQTGDQVASKLKQVVKHPRWIVKRNPVDAYLAAMAQANAEDSVVIFGSFYIVGDIISYVEQTNQQTN